VAPFQKTFWLILAAGIGAAGAAALLLYLSVPDVAHLKTRNPRTTALMKQRQREARQADRSFSIRQVWVGFDRIPEMLKHSVRIAEDARFYEHEGIDYEEIGEALKTNWTAGRLARGASTITQQLAKNLFLSTEKNIIRKAKEYFIARRLEDELTKDRIFHIYLNVIELGPGIFGVEAASRHYFGKSAARLSLGEIVRLTAVIPKPLAETPTRNSRWVRWKAGWILSVLRKTGKIDSAEYETALMSLKGQSEAP
jgi:monofunctional biosynthetic peptidoglycan transglycosylase